ncbi:MAG: translation elongation factor Ts [Thermaerobacter sp.]|nr:translation elongation factor Ts [Thermaerobacter sp.]
MEITAEIVKELRTKTGAGMMDCKRALTEAGGSIERAVELLRERGLSQAAKKAGREASEGLVETYVHANGRIGVLLEVNCETDFVARNQEFRSVVHEIALQVAAARPRYVRREEVPEDLVAAERRIYEAQAANEGKPEKIAERIVQGRLEKFYQETCLLEQVYIKDDKKRVQDLVTEMIAKLGENIQVRRFARFEVGEEAGTTQEA